MSTPATILIFNGNNNLDARVLPMLDKLLRNSDIPQGTRIVRYGVPSIPTPKPLAAFELTVRPDADSEAKIAAHFKSLEAGQSGPTGVAASKNRVFYLSNSIDDSIPAIVRNAFTPTGTNRIILEGPSSAGAEYWPKWAAILKAKFKDTELYFMNSIFGYDITQQILPLRFANVTTIWDRTTVQKVTLTFKSKTPVDASFNNGGIVANGVASLLEVLALVAMERPASTSDEDLRAARAAVLKQVEAVESDDFLLGKYDYAQGAAGVAPTKATYASGNVRINNERWKAVPFALEAARGSDEDRIEVKVLYKNVPTGDYVTAPPNTFTISIAPSPGLSLSVNLSQPDLGSNSGALPYSAPASALADEQLFLDALAGKQGYFSSIEEINEIWRILGPLADSRVVPYKPGTVPTTVEDDLLAAARKFVAAMQTYNADTFKASCHTNFVQKFFPLSLGIEDRNREVCTAKLAGIWGMVDGIKINTMEPATMVDVKRRRVHLHCNAIAPGRGKYTGIGYRNEYTFVMDFAKEDGVYKVLIWREFVDSKGFLTFFDAENLAKLHREETAAATK